jgi:hypothetical protein
MGITVCCLVAVYLLGDAHEPSKGPKAGEHAQWVAKVLTEIQTIEAGKTRGDLLRIFTTEGGLSSRTWRTYVHKECPHIKVDVRFKPVGNLEDKFGERPEDAIVEISRPYLQWPII